MAFRIPRGYAVNRPPYVELCEGQRPNVQTIPLTAYTGLGPVRVDQLHHDPIVIDAGTIVGIATGSRASGSLLPVIWNTGSSARTITMHHHSDGAEWGLPTTSGDLTPGNVKPLGVVFAPVYSFRLNDFYNNYQRAHNVGIVTDYVVQIPARTLTEHAIRTGDVLMAADAQYAQGNLSTGNIQGSAANAGGEAGGWKRREALTSGNPDVHALVSEFVVGRCLRSSIVATGTANTKFSADTALVITAEGKSEFKGLNLVEVRGTVSGSATKGVPGHVLEGYSDGSGNYRLLTILVRL